MSEVHDYALLDEPWTATCARMRNGQHVHFVNAYDPDDVMCSADPHCEGADHMYIEPAPDTSSASDTRPATEGNADG